MASPVGAEPYLSSESIGGKAPCLPAYAGIRFFFMRARFCLIASCRLKSFWKVFLFRSDLRVNIFFAIF